MNGPPAQIRKQAGRAHFNIAIDNFQRVNELEDKYVSMPVVRSQIVAFVYVLVLW